MITAQHVECIVMATNRDKNILHLMDSKLRTMNTLWLIDYHNQVNERTKKN